MGDWVERGVSVVEKVKIYRDRAMLGAVDLFYRETRSQGDAILCLHGRWGRGETWVDFMMRYGARYRVVAPDQRGHGLSGRPPSRYTAEEMACDAVDLLTALGIDAAVLVGHSMGGRIAGHVAALYPERVKALVILDKSASGCSPKGILENDLEFNKDPMTKDWPMPFQTRMESIKYIKEKTNSELEFQYFMDSLVETVDGYEMMFSQSAIAKNIINDNDWFDILEKITCDVMMIRSHKSKAVSDEDFLKMQKKLKKCVLKETSGSDHNIHVENKEEFYCYFDDFLKEIDFRDDDGKSLGVSERHGVGKCHAG